MFADRYEIGAPLGRGGMAEVFAAVAHGAHGFVRRVAIKRLAPEIGADAHLVRMFFDEARIASHLHHSGIVAVLDYGIVDGCPFQVLELVEGWNAGALVQMARRRGQSVPVEIALLLATEVAHALAYAHERKDDSGRALGIVHRDVKPSNILVSTSGDIKLGDFGIALARERSAVTTGFIARGTPGYMSPEQLLGGQVEPTADIFALGISLHGLLTGESPIKADGYRALLAGNELALSPDLPLDAREIIHRAVRLRSEERYPSAREMAKALGEVLAPRLETDATTRMVQWLVELDAQRPPLDPTTTAFLAPADAPGRFSLQAVPQPTAPSTPRASGSLAPPAHRAPPTSYRSPPRNGADAGPEHHVVVTPRPMKVAPTPRTVVRPSAPQAHIVTTFVIAAAIPVAIALIALIISFFVHVPTRP